LPSDLFATLERERDGLSSLLVEAKCVVVVKAATLDRTLVGGEGKRRSGFEVNFEKTVCLAAFELPLGLLNILHEIGFKWHLNICLSSERAGKKDRSLAMEKIFAPTTFEVRTICKGQLALAMSLVQEPVTAVLVTVQVLVNAKAMFDDVA
jgi:hypothetical protein